MKKTKLLIASLFVLALTSCDSLTNNNSSGEKKDEYVQVTESEWKAAFTNFNYSNCSLEYDVVVTSLGRTGKEIFKFENENKFYMCQAVEENGKQERNEAICNLEDGKYYGYAKTITDTKYKRGELTEEMFNLTKEECQTGLKTCSLLNEFEDRYSEFTYDESKNEYNGKLEISQDEITATVNLNLKFSDEKELVYLKNVLTVVSTVENGLVADGTVLLNNVGTTVVEIPTDYEDYNFSA